MLQAKETIRANPTFWRFIERMRLLELINVDLDAQSGAVILPGAAAAACVNIASEMSRTSRGDKIDDGTDRFASAIFHAN